MRAPIFIFASAWRCGSTLLQRWLNSYPGVRIWGEHDGILQGVFNEIRRLHVWDKNEEGHRELFYRAGSDTFTPNLMPPRAAIMEATRAFVEALWAAPALAEKQVIWGFKEVRYSKEIAEMLVQAFPGARCIHITRNPADIFVSLRRWLWAEDGLLRAMDLWENVNTSFAHARESWLLSCRYEDIVRGSDHFSERCAAFLKLDQKRFDSTVFDRRLSGRTLEMDAMSTVLSEEERLLIMSPSRVSLMKHFGYIAEDIDEA